MSITAGRGQRLGHVTGSEELVLHDAVERGSLRGVGMQQLLNEMLGGFGDVRRNQELVGSDAHVGFFQGLSLERRPTHQHRVPVDNTW